MAGLKVPRRSVATEVATILNSPEVAALVAELEAIRFVGRRGYGSRALLGACLVKALYALPTWTRVADLIAEHPGLSDALGGTPSHWACYRFSTKLRKESARIAGCLDALTASLRDFHPDMGTEVAIDGSDMPAYANGQRYLYHHGPERQSYSDPDASWGHRSAISTRKGGGFYGYKLHAAVCTRTGLPLAWQVETARRNDSLYVAPLLDALDARGFRPETCAMDKGYDAERVYAECETRGCSPIIPLRGKKGKQIVLDTGTIDRLSPRVPRHTERWRDLYKARTSVEREFGRLKHQYGLAFLRVRGIERVRLHADLVMLGRLSHALARVRTPQVAA